MHDTRTREMNETELQELRARFRGELITPADPAYEGARKVYDAMIDRRPALIAFSPPLMDFAGPIPFPVLQCLFDGLSPAGLQWYWKADFFEELSDKVVDLHVKYGHRLPSPHSTMHLYPIDVPARRVGKGDTAFRFREANFAEVIVGVDPDPANNTRLVQWAKDYWLALHPFSAGGGCVNMMMDDGADNVKAAYRDNYARLAQVKRKYDPANLFRINQNIRPADA